MEPAVRSWIAGPGLAGRATWVSVQPQQRDPQRFWIDLPRLELRRTAPGEVPALRAVAAGWYAEHAQPVEAERERGTQARSAEEWTP